MDERPGFFKFFIPELCSQRMQIPPAFAANYMRGQRIKNATFLRDRHGNTWPVEISVEGRAFFFDKGWVGFVKDNQIELGDFLVFKLSDNHLFDFKHFGRSACEKEKPLSFMFTVKQEELELGGEEEDDNEEEEEEEEEEEVAVNIGNCAEEDDHYDEGEEEEEDDDDDDDDEENDEDDGDYEENEEVYEDVDVVELEDNEKNDEENEKKEKESKRGSKKRKKYTPRITREDIKKIKEEIFGSGVPIPQNPYFVLKIRPQNRRELFIPVDVVRYHGLELKSELKIVNEMGKGSISKVKVWSSGRVALKGWSTFCEFNHLKMDDKCLLEFVPDGKNKTQLCLQVRIFRA